MEKAVALVYTQRIRPRLAILYWRVCMMCVHDVCAHCSKIPLLFSHAKSFFGIFGCLYKWG